MWEKIKTIALLTLVILSLVLTYHLWFGSPEYEAITPPSYEELSFGDPLPLESLLLPKKIVYVSPVEKTYEEVPREEPEFDPGEDSTLEDSPEDLQEDPQEEVQEGSGEEGEAQGMGSAEKKVSEREDDPEPETETETETDVKPESEPEPELEIEKESETETETEVETEPENELETGHEVEPEPGPGDEKPAAAEFHIHYSHALYSDIWDIIKCELMTITSLSCTLTDFSEIKEGVDRFAPSLEIHFSAPFLLDLYFSDQEGSPTFPQAEKLVLSLGEERGNDYLKTPQGEIYRLDWNFNHSRLSVLEDEESEREEYRYSLLKDIIKEGEGIEEYFTAGEIFVPANPSSLPKLDYNKESLDIDKLVKVFFVDCALVRHIKQRDEAVMYTDGQRGLRLDSRGFIEYSAPARTQEGRELSYREALNRGVDFVTMYGGWPRDLNLRITELNIQDLEQEEYYQLKLKSYYRGIPLGLDPWDIELTFNEQGLTGYQRQVYLVEDEREDEGGDEGGDDWEEVEVMEIENALSHLVSREADLFSTNITREVTDCFLAYIPAGDSGDRVMEACWIVEIDGHQKFIINARNGTIIDSTP